MVTGYGHLAPKTVGGRAFTIPYAIWGIPICLVMLAGIGSKFNDIADTLEKKIPICKYDNTYQYDKNHIFPKKMLFDYSANRSVFFIYNLVM